MFNAATEWVAPGNWPDLKEYTHIAIDLETRDEGINSGQGAGWATGNGNIIGFAVAIEGWQGYYPFAHYGGGNMSPQHGKKYIKDIIYF